MILEQQAWKGIGIGPLFFSVKHNWLYPSTHTHTSRN